MTAKDVQVLVVNNAEDAVEDFVRPIHDVVTAARVSCRIVPYRQLPTAVREPHCAVILSASPLGDDIVEHHQPYFGWLRTHDVPVLGICAGHQIIGMLFGGTLQRSIESEIGVSTVRVVREDPLLEGLGTEFKVSQSHHDSITCPSEFMVLASSDKCVNQVMRHRVRPIFSTQFHAEMSRTEIIVNFVRGPGVVTCAT